VRRWSATDDRALPHTTSHIFSRELAAKIGENRCEKSYEI